MPLHITQCTSIERLPSATSENCKHSRVHGIEIDEFALLLQDSKPSLSIPKEYTHSQ